MKRSKKRAIILSVAVLFLLFNIVGVAYYFYKTSVTKQNNTNLQINYHQEESPAISQSNNKIINSQSQIKNIEKDNYNDAKNHKASTSPLIKIQEDDFYLGDKNAPIVFIEYASLSCPHCAEFTKESFLKLKENYIDQGKMVFSFRSFPLNNQALISSLVAECYANQHTNKHQKYFDILKILFRTQEEWAFDKNFSDKLKAILKLDGLSAAKFDECIKNQKLIEKNLKTRIDAIEQLSLKSTPTFFINGKIVEGFMEYSSLKKIIDQIASDTIK
jgi:protein-disulfide isomerase